MLVAIVITGNEHKIRIENINIVYNIEAKTYHEKYRGKNANSNEVN